MIYAFLRPLVAFALRQFFREIRVRGAAPVATGPVLVVSNHPNCGLDPMLIALVYRRSLWFIAKAALFKHPAAAWFLRQAHLVPIVRSQDNPDLSREERAALNRESFAAATSILCSNRALLIFPEGTSMGDRKLYPIKTGAARIALQAREQAGKGFDLKVQAVGITYSVIHQFKSTATIVFDEPVDMSKYVFEGGEASPELVRQITREIEERIRCVSVDIDDEETAALTEKIAQLYRSDGSPFDDEQLLRTIVTNIELLTPRFPERRRDIEARIDSFLELYRTVPLESTGVRVPFADELFLTIASPAILLGAALAYPPYRLVGRLVKALTADRAWHATFKLGLGVAMFPLWYLIVAIVCGLWLGKTGCFALFFIGVASGLLANRYLDDLRLLALVRLWPGESGAMVGALRDSLITELNELRVQ